MQLVSHLSSASKVTAAKRIAAAPKYQRIHADTIADIVEQEAAFATSPGDLERRARLRLHKVIADSLLSARPSRILRGLDACATDPEALRAWCREVLSRHFSTAERLGSLDTLYPAILEVTGPVNTIADLACALNPFTMPWLRDATDAVYTGYALNLMYVQLGARFLAATGMTGEVRHRDVLVHPEQITTGLALLLKTFHCIEDRRPGAALRLVEQVGARHVAGSFPERTMSGRAATFRHDHIDRLSELTDRRGWAMSRTGVTGEDVVIITKTAGPT